LFWGLVTELDDVEDVDVDVDVDDDDDDDDGSFVVHNKINCIEPNNVRIRTARCRIRRSTIMNVNEVTARQEIWNPLRTERGSDLFLELTVNVGDLNGEADLSLILTVRLRINSPTECAGCIITNTDFE
jgi:hypothetical protein